MVPQSMVGPFTVSKKPLWLSCEFRDCVFGIVVQVGFSHSVHIHLILTHSTIQLVYTSSRTLFFYLVNGKIKRRKN